MTGSLLGIDQDGIAHGWAQDLDTPATSISVYIYVGGGAAGYIAATIDADLPITDPVTGAHGFQFPIPSRFRDDASHTIEVYAKSGSGAFALLAGAPRTFSLAPTIVRIDNGVIRVGIEPRCGGTIAEISLRGQNFVNNFDCTGRQIQAALYDGSAGYDTCAACTGVWGWNPVQGGDMYNFGSPVTALTVGDRSITTVTRPYEWYPDNKGGGRGQPVLSDVVIEQAVSFLDEDPYAVRVHYRVTHLGTDAHAPAGQELPAVYVNLGFDQFVSYAGSAPWTGDTTTSVVLGSPGTALPRLSTSEHWAAFTDGAGYGLTIYSAQQEPYGGGFRMTGGAGEWGSGANYYQPLDPVALGPGAVLERDILIVAGDYRDARRSLATLRNAVDDAVVDAVTDSDIAPPAVSIASLQAATNKKTVTVTVLSSDNVGVARVDVYVDGRLAASDASSPYVLVMPVKDLSNKGTHSFVAVSYDAAGNSASSAPVAWTKH